MPKGFSASWKKFCKKFSRPPEARHIHMLLILLNVRHLLTVLLAWKENGLCTEGDNLTRSYHERSERFKKHAVQTQHHGYVAPSTYQALLLLSSATISISLFSHYLAGSSSLRRASHRVQNVFFLCRRCKPECDQHCLSHSSFLLEIS